MKHKKTENAGIPELICELTRNCNMKEETFAASFNMTPTEVRFLKLFAFEQSYSIKEIKEKLNLTSGRITHILKKLEAKNLIVRVTDKSDKRNVYVKILPKGMPFIQNLLQNYNHLHEDILKNISEDEIKNIQNSLKTLLGVFKKWVEEN